MTPNYTKNKTWPSCLCVNFQLLFISYAIGMN